MASVGAAAVRIANLLCDGRPPRPSRVLLLVGVECQENEPSVQFALCLTGTRPIEPDSPVPTIPARQKPPTPPSLGTRRSAGSYLILGLPVSGFCLAGIVGTEESGSIGRVPVEQGANWTEGSFS